jgi:hypothetical protein
MAGFMRKIAGYDEGGSVTSNPGVVTEEEDDFGTPKDNSLAVMPAARRKLIIPADYTQEKMLAALIKGTDNLSRPRTDKSEKWLAIAAALGQPTRTGTIGETASNVAGAVGKFKAEQRAEDQKRLTDALTLQKGVYDIVSDEAKADETYQTKVNAALIAAKRPLAGSYHDYRDENTDHYMRLTTAMTPDGPVTYRQDITAGTAPIALPGLRTTGTPAPGALQQTANAPAPKPPASPLQTANVPAPKPLASPLQTAGAPLKTDVSAAIAASQPQAEAAPPQKTYLVLGKQRPEGEMFEASDGITYKVLPGGGIKPVTGQSVTSKTAQAVSEATGKAKGEALVVATNAWPKVQTLAEQERQAIQDLRTQPGLNAILGLGIDPLKGAYSDIQEKDPQSGETKSRPRIVAGSPAADAYEAYNRVSGGVWLQGYQDALKGTGPVATKEGESAAKATATLGRTQSPVAFNRHVDEYEAQIIRSTRVAQNLKGETPNYGLPPRNKAEAQPGQVFIAANGTVVKAAKDPATGKIEMYPLNAYWQAHK